MLNAALDHPDVSEVAANHYEIATVIANVCGSRGDLPGELLAMYRKDNPKRPLAKVLKRGLADAIKSLSSYAIQKYAPRGKGAYRLRDVLFLVRPKPRDDVQAEWFKMLADDTLPQANTWETQLSAGADKRETFATMLREGSLGALAILRNLRNMVQAGVPHLLVETGLFDAVSRSKFGILPFQFVAAARAVPSMENAIEAAMLAGIRSFVQDNVTDPVIGTSLKLLQGHTIILVDVSGSMQQALSAKSTLARSDAAGAMAILLREVCQDVSVFDYNTSVREVPARRGFALRDAMRRPLDGTYTGKAAHAVLHEVARRLGRSPERIIVITDEQSRDTLPPLPTGTRGYVMNVAPHQNGIAWGRWTTVSGFSENLVQFIMDVEAQA
jgi:hypothetical protein